MSSELKTNKISPATGTALQIGDSGDTITIPSGATIANSGTATGFSSGTANEPNFYVKTSADQAWSASYTKFVFNTLVSESDTGSFDTTTNYRFTVPSGKGGTYLFAQNFGNQNGTNWYVKTLKNGTDELWWASSSIDDAGGNQKRTHVVVAELAAGDYVEWLKYSGTTWTNFGSELYGVRLHT